MVDSLSMTNTGSLRTRLLLSAVLPLAMLSALPAAGAGAQGQEAPRLVYISPANGDTLEEPAFVFQLCFAEPIDTRDQIDGGQWAFAVREPDGQGLGHRDAFQGDGLGVTVNPGRPPGIEEGEWTFTWRVSSPDGLQSTEGEIKYTVDTATGKPVSREVPQLCIGEAGTVSPSPIRETQAATPEPSATVEGEPTPSERPGGGATDDDDEPDILVLALLTIGAAGGAALIALIGYFVRRAVGYEPHKPSGDGAGHGEHH